MKTLTEIIDGFSLKTHRQSRLVVGYMLNQLKVHSHELMHRKFNTFAALYQSR